MHSSRPVLQAMPSAVSRSDSAQMDCSSRGNSLRSSAWTSAGSAAQAVPLATNTATPHAMGKVWMWLVTRSRPMVLPDIVPVMAQSMLPLRMAATISAKPVCTGTAPSAVTKSAMAGLETRTRRPARSARPVIALLQ